MEVVLEASSVPDFAVVGKEAEQDARQPLSEVVGVVAGSQHGIVDLCHEFRGFEVELGLVGDRVVGAAVPGEPPEHIEVLAEVFQVEATLVLGDDVVPVEVPEVSGHQEARLHF